MLTATTEPKEGETVFTVSVRPLTAPPVPTPEDDPRVVAPTISSIGSLEYRKYQRKDDV